MDRKTVKAVRRLQENPELVYNIATANHNYFAGGILVHNCDDPHKADAVKSSVQLENDLEWLKTVWPTRKMSMTSVEVIIMQRLHERDVTGYLLSEQLAYEHLVLPMRFEGVPCVRVYLV